MATYDNGNNNCIYKYKSRKGKERSRNFGTFFVLKKLNINPNALAQKRYSGWPGGHLHFSTAGGGLQSAQTKKCKCPCAQKTFTP